MKDCCKGNMVWVNKYLDLDVPKIDQQGKLIGGYSHVDINLWVCRFCGYVKASAD